MAFDLAEIFITVVSAFQTYDCLSYFCSNHKRSICEFGICGEGGDGGITEK